MKTPSRTSNQFLKFILIITLALSSRDLLASSQQNAAAYNDARQSSNQSQALSCELTPASNQYISESSLSNNAKTIIDRDEDLENSAATMSVVQMGPAKKQANPTQDQETSPSVTSVHQVWTSSSSGSIGELSPEIISKLRNDVPFLAAYALRPRLVGASSYGNKDDELNIKSSSTNFNKLDASNQPIETYVGQLQAPAKLDKASLQVQASSPTATKSLIPKLGDFSEFNVETSSTSKSEHHHKRKTTLKRKPNANEHLDLKKQTSVGATNQSIKGGRNLLNKSNKSIDINKKQRSRTGKTSKRSLKKSKSRSRSNKSRAKLSGSNMRQHMNIIKNGRYYQEQSINPSGTNNSTDLVVDSKVAGDQTTMIVRGTKNSSEGDVKGASSGEKKPPFYSRVKPSVDTDEPTGSIDKSIDSTYNPDDGSDINGLNRNRPKDDQGSESGNDANEDTLEEPPRRVGDDDIEEDGDTVTVMPKSDGVDDDPEIPAGAPEEDQRGPTDGDQGETSEREDDTGSGEPDNRIPESDPRGKRVDRERPNPSLQPSDSRENDEGQDITTGGGIGATTGAGSGSSEGAKSAPENRNTSPNSSDDTDADDDDLGSNHGEFGNRDSSMERNDGTQTDDNRAISGRKETKDRPEIDKESIGKDGEENDRSDGGLSGSDVNTKTGPGFDSERDSGNSASSGEPDEFGSRRDSNQDNNNNNNNQNVGGIAKPLCPEDGPSCSNGADEGGDVDYRDEMTEVSGRKNGRNGTEIETGQDEQGVKKNRKKHGERDENCDDHHKDGHYDHHAHDHHDHHDSIKWLQDAIPGEPGEDYPILSRINLSNFNCRDQKYPGYYADVQSRCQVSVGYLMN